MKHQPADPVLLAEFLRRSGVSYSSQSRSYVFTCPKCGKADKLWMYHDGSRFVCFACPRFSGAVEWALSRLSGRDVESVRRSIYKNLTKGDDGGFVFCLDPDAEEDDVDNYEDPLSLDDAPDLAWPLDCVPLDDRSGAPGAAYLERRGIPRDLAMEYDVRYSTSERAIAFPAYVGPQLVAWQYRFLKDRVYKNKSGKTVTMKVRSTEDVPRDRVVLFQDRMVAGGDAVLCEGPVDALKAHYWGGNVAAMGKSVSYGQVLRIIRSGVKRVFLALDPDAAESKDSLVRQFSGSVEVFDVSVPNKYKDLGEMPLDEAVDAIAAAKPARPGDIYLYFE